MSLKHNKTPTGSFKGHGPFQTRTAHWVQTCFGATEAYDRDSRANRFVEESLELAQSAGKSKGDVLALVDYVYSRPTGDLRQEIGGVMVTLAALSESFGADMAAEAEIELNRVWGKLESIREKNKKKPKDSPLPGPSAPPSAEMVDHPDHYNGSPSGVECIDFVKFMSFPIGSAVKYIWRLGRKTEDVQQELKKALWYIDCEKRVLSAPDIDVYGPNLPVTQKKVKSVLDHVHPVLAVALGLLFDYSFGISSKKYQDPEARYTLLSVAEDSIKTYLRVEGLPVEKDKS